MSIGKIIFTGCLPVFVQAFVCRAQDAGAKPTAQPAVDSSDQIIQVVQLSHISAQSVERALRELKLSLMVSAVGEEVLILSGPAAQVKVAVDKVVAPLDSPETAVGRSPGTVAYIKLPPSSTDHLAKLVGAITADGRTRLAIDRDAGMLVVRGSPKEIAEVQQLMSQIARPARSLNLQFFFIRGAIDGKSASTTELPKSLQEVGRALMENGIGELKLLAPMMVNVDDGNKFSSGAKLMRENDSSDRVTQLNFEVSGSARLQPEDSLAQVSIRAEVSGGLGEDGNEASWFQVDTTIAAKLGDYVILAASPSSTPEGDAVALVVRVLPDGKAQN